MGLWSRLFGRAETKAVDLSPELWAAINGGWGIPTKSGGQVSTASALQITAFYRAILVIAEGVAQLPVHIYKRLPNGRGAEPATDHPLYDVLHTAPSELQDSFQFWRSILMHAAGAGNGVAYKNVVNGQVRELIPVRPECVQIDLHIGTYLRTFDITFEKGGYASVGQDAVFHISGPSWSPFKGLDPVVVGREALGLASATEQSHAAFHANGTRPSGILTAEGKLGEDQVKALKAQWAGQYGGSGNTGKTPVLSGGLKWQQIALTGVDAEHLDTRKHQIEEIARLTGVFPIMLGHAGDQSPTFASAEAFFAAHLRYTLQPWMTAVARAVNKQLLTADERREGYYCFIDASEFMRGSIKDRAEYYKAALGTNSSPGWLTQNEIREDDGWNPSADKRADEIWQPAQTMTAGGAASPPARPEAKARPRTLYVSRKLLNGREFLEWAAKQGFKSTLDADDLHVTIAYSRAPVDWIACGQAWGTENGGLRIPPGGPRVVEPIGPKGAVALKFASTDLSWRHMAIREAGASWDWPDYEPHVTITYEPGAVDIAKVEPFRGELRFGPEVFQEIDETR